MKDHIFELRRRIRRHVRSLYTHTLSSWKQGKVFHSIFFPFFFSYYFISSHLHRLGRFRTSQHASFFHSGIPLQCFLQRKHLLDFLNGTDIHISELLLSIRLAEVGKRLSRVARRWIRLIQPSNLWMENLKSVTNVNIVIKSCSILLSRPVDIGEYLSEISRMFL